MPKSKTSHKNREFAVITYLFLAVFVGMMIYFAYFQFALSEDFINSPYNTRQDSFAILHQCALAIRSLVPQAFSSPVSVQVII